MSCPDDGSDGGNWPQDRAQQRTTTQWNRRIMRDFGVVRCHTGTKHKTIICIYTHGRTFPWLQHVAAQPCMLPHRNFMEALPVWSFGFPGVVFGLFKVVLVSLAAAKTCVAASDAIQAVALQKLWKVRNAPAWRRCGSVP